VMTDAKSLVTLMSMGVSVLMPGAVPGLKKIKGAKTLLT